MAESNWLFVDDWGCGGFGEGYEESEIIKMNNEIVSHHNLIFAIIKKYLNSRICVSIYPNSAI